MTATELTLSAAQVGESDVHALVARAQSGDRDAFAELYRAHMGFVRGVLLAWVSPDDVPDLAHDTFLMAMRNIASLRDPAAFAQWLGSIARNVARAHHRRGKISVPLPDNMPASPPQPEPSDEALRILKAVHGLPTRLREPLLLRLVEGMSGEEIARALGISHGAVRVALHRGIKLLRTQLEKP